MTHFKSFWFFLIFLLLGSSLVVGCSTPKRTGYLPNYDKLHKGEYLEKYRSNTSLIEKKNYSTIRVEVINVEKISDQKGVTAEDCREWMKNALVSTASTSGSRFVFEVSTDGEQAKLEIAITDMSPGDAVKRIVAGELGMGHAWVQVEGRILDLESNEEVAAFSERRRSSGIIGLKDVGGDAGPILVREMLEQIAADIIQEVKEDFAF